MADAPSSQAPEGAVLWCGESFEEPLVLEGPFGVVCVYTSPDPVRSKLNEDSAAMIRLEDDGVILAVADGMGGGPSGAEASRCALECVRESLLKRDDDGPTPRDAILAGIERAADRVAEVARGAGTTLVAAEVLTSGTRIYHVGDSEAFLVGGRGKVKWRTTPHSPTGYAVEAGLVSERQALKAERRHLLTNAIGAGPMKIEMSRQLRLAARDTLLLASDGLLDNLYPAEIIEALRGKLPDVAARLVESARSRMMAPSENAPSKPDDLTLVLFRRA